MTSPPQAPRDAQTVPVRVQVIDLQPRTVDLVVPSYLKADDLTQRIARDVGLGAWWEDGSRRTFYLRARGRVLRGDERLQDLGVVPYELLHLLPQPRMGDPVRERPVGVSEPLSQPISAASRVLRVVAVLAWSALFALGAWADPASEVAFFGCVGLAWLAGSAVHRVGATPRAGFVARGLGVGVVLGMPAWVLGYQSSVTPEDGAVFLAVAMGGAILGGAVTWLAHLGPLEPVPEEALAVGQAGDGDAVTVDCAICNLDVEEEVIERCPYGCARVFHRGCLRAKQAVATGEGCEVCGARVNRHAVAR